MSKRLQKTLFPMPPKPRAKPRKLLYVYDAGPGLDERDMVHLKCSRCGYDSDWIAMRVSEVKRGVPCPECNK